MYYLHTNYQGSYESITNAEGAVVEKLSFDPWGRRRNPHNWTFTDIPETYLFDRGYTGHEHLDAFGLVNMNGRMYDPMLGRFLSPDNYVQAPDYTQNFNRYSYVLNNPLKYTDPSGEKWWHWALADILTGGLISIGATAIISTCTATSIGINSSPGGLAAAAWVSGFFSASGWDNRLVEGDRRARNSWEISEG